MLLVLFGKRCISFTNILFYKRQINFKNPRSLLWILFIFAILIFYFTIKSFNIPLKSKGVNSWIKYAKKKKMEHNLFEKVAEEYGKDSIEEGKLSDTQIKKTLTEMFNKADTNNDKLLDMTELTDWIHEKVKEHLVKALKENFFIFTAIDQKPRNGAISWDEYLVYTLRKHGYKDSEIDKYKSSIHDLPRKIKEKIMKDRADWSEAAREDPSRLSIDEFLAFRHPESSHSNIMLKVDDALGKFDLDGDALLTEQEFLEDEEKDNMGQESLEAFKNDKLREFRQNIDTNKDGKLERKELVQYFNPKHRHHSEKDADHLIGMGDMNDDNKLSLQEILMSQELFMLSKFVNVGISFHDEF